MTRKTMRSRAGRHAAGRPEPGVVGRAAELARLRERLRAAAAGRPGVALVTGPAGIGKSALLGELARGGAGGPRVVGATGDELETLLPMAVVEQLVLRLAGREAAAALGGAPDAPAAGVLLLRAIGTAAQERPLLIVIDDAQWADAPSLAAITFAMRRAYADPVLLVLAGRDELLGHLPGGLRRLARGERGVEIALEGLRAHALAELATRLGAELPSPRAAARLREHTGGNPLHALALLRELEPADLAGPQDPLPAPRSHRRQTLSALAAVSERARDLAVAASVLGRRAPLELAARLAGLADPLPALEEAVAAGLLRPLDGHGERAVAFADPLARGAVYHDLGPARRAALHARAAGLLTGAAALDHRAAAALGPDAGLADALAGAARDARDAGDPARAAARLVAAARLDAGPRAGRRRLDAVELLLDAGEVSQAAALAGAAMRDDPRERFLRGRIALVRARPAPAEALLAEAWSGAQAAGDRDLAARAALARAELGAVAGRADDVRRWAERARAAGAGGGCEARGLALLALSHGMRGAPGDGLDLLPAWPAPPGTGRAALEPLAVRAVLLAWAGREREAAGDVERVLAAERPGAGLPTRVAALTVLAWVRHRLGRWEEARSHADEALALARDGEQSWLLPVVEGVAAALAAARGELDAAARHATAAASLARGHGLGAAAAAAAWAEAEAGAARGDPDGAMARASEILEEADAPVAGTAAWRLPMAEALAALERAEEAAALLEGLSAASPAGRAALARVRGTIEASRRRPGAAAAAFAEARELLADVPLPFERARLDHAEGRALRRAGDRDAALPRLESARAAYARLGARRHLEWCARELAACGAAGRASRAGERPLTPQEWAVARLVAEGLTNRAVADELVVSVKTVEFHLGNVYAKLGVRSRTQLAVALARDRDGLTGSGGG